MTHSVPQTQFAMAAALEYTLHGLQKWSKTPWITEHTKGITRATRAALAFFATLGIAWQYDAASHSLIITGLAATAILTGLVHWGARFLSQYTMAHCIGGMVKGGNLDAIKAIVIQAIEEYHQTATVQLSKVPVTPAAPSGAPTNSL